MVVEAHPAGSRGETSPLDAPTLRPTQSDAPAAIPIASTYPADVANYGCAATDPTPNARPCVMNRRCRDKRCSHCVATMGLLRRPHRSETYGRSPRLPIANRGPAGSWEGLGRRA